MTDFILSRLSTFFIIIPFEAPKPVPTIIAVGVASPRAHGQAITMTAMKFSIAAVNEMSNTKYQVRKVITANPITIGTKTDATLSARL